MTVDRGEQLDAYRPSSDGVYATPHLLVRRSRTGSRRTDGVHTKTFDLHRDRGRLLIDHHLGTESVSDDLTGLLSEELFDAGWLRGPELFEELFVGVVLTCAEDPLDAWSAFYRNTIARLDETVTRPGGEGSIAAYAPVHAQIAALVRGTRVLELGCCFGFQALRLARDGYRVTASDLSPATIKLLDDMSRRLGIPLRTLVADAARVSLRDDVADTVLAIHLLEHVEEELTLSILREACRLARRRVVVAVPFEDVPSEEYGHLRALTLDDLRSWGRATGWAWHAYEHHGGWLVLDAA